MSDDVASQLRALADQLERQAPPVRLDELTARRAVAAERIPAGTAVGTAASPIAEHVTHDAPILPIRRRSAATWVGAAALLIVIVGVATLVVATVRPAPSPTGPTSGSGTAPSSPANPDARGGSTLPARASDVVAGLFVPTAVPEGFGVVEANTSTGRPPNLVTRVSAETWVSSDGSGAIDGMVRLSASRWPVREGVAPADPSGLTVHGEPAQPLTPGDSGTAVRWEEQGLTLLVTSWGPDAASIAERAIVGASTGITLPDGALPEEFSRLVTRADPSLLDGLSSYLAFATGDGSERLSLLAQPNATGETADTLGSAPGYQRRTVGGRDVWLVTTDGGWSARWIDGDHVLSAGGDVDEVTLLSFVSSVEPASAAEFDAFVVRVSAVDEQLTEYDRAVFTDGLAVSLRSISDINTPEVSSFGRRALCITGDRTLCTGARPSTEFGLLTTVTSTRTINGERELFIWIRVGRTVTRVYDRSTGVDLPFETATGSAGTFVRAKAPADVTAIDFRSEVTESPGLGGSRQAELDLLDAFANVNAPVAPPG